MNEVVANAVTAQGPGFAKRLTLSTLESPVLVVLMMI
jgi:hypothetical protein